MLTAPRQPGELRILGLGTSLLWAATPQEEFDPQRQHPQLHWMRLTKSGQGIGALAASLTEIGQAPPDMLVIEKGLFFLDNHDAETERMKIDIKRRLKAVLLTLLPAALAPSPAAQLQQAQRNSLLSAQSRAHACEGESGALSAAQFNSRAKHARLAYAQPQPDPLLVAHLRRLMDRGVQVVILDVPRTTRLELTSASEKARWFARLHHALPPGPSLRYLAAPSYDHSLYCDGAHLNRSGSHLFGAWWLTQLAAIVKSGA